MQKLLVKQKLKNNILWLGQLVNKLLDIDKMYKCQLELEKEIKTTYKENAI